MPRCLLTCQLNIPRHASLLLNLRLNPRARSAVSHAMLYSAAVRLPRAAISSTRPRSNQRRTTLGLDIYHYQHYPAHQWIYHVRPRPWLHRRFEGSTKLSHHTWTLKRGLDSNCVRRKPPCMGGGTSQFERILPQRLKNLDIAVNVDDSGLP